MPLKIPPAAAPAQLPGPAGATLDYYDPAGVAIGANYRLPAGDSHLADDELDAVLGIDAAWLDDLAATGGNLEPVALLNRTPTSDDPRPYLVKHGGARRVRGCYRAGLKLYAYVTGDEGDGRAENLARLLNQWRENHNRKPTDAAADARAIQSMLDFGMTDAAVCKTLRLKGGKGTIAAARKVVRSNAAALAAAAHPLDMAKAAQIADFDDAGDDEAVAKLDETLDFDPDQFAHVAQQLRDTAAERAQRRQVITSLEAAGVPVIDEQNDTWERRIEHLRDARGDRITGEQHQSCPGHAAYVDSTHVCREGKWQSEWTPVFICTDPDSNGHSSYISRVHGSPDQTPAERQAELDQKRWSRAGNTEWRSATSVRVEHIAEKIAPLTRLPKDWDVAAYRLSVLGSDGYNLRYAMERGHEQACAWLGVKEKTNGARRDSLRKLVNEADRVRAVADRGAPGPRQARQVHARGPARHPSQAVQYAVRPQHNAEARVGRQPGRKSLTMPQPIQASMIEDDQAHNRLPEIAQPRRQARSVRVSFWCRNGHQTTPCFAASAAIPEFWDCTQCGLPAGQDEMNPPAPAPTAPRKTHLDYLKERRSAADGAAILAEALARLKESRQGQPTQSTDREAAQSSSPLGADDAARRAPDRLMRPSPHRHKPTQAASPAGRAAPTTGRRSTTTAIAAVPAPQPHPAPAPPPAAGMARCRRCRYTTRQCQCPKGPLL